MTNIEPHQRVEKKLAEFPRLIFRLIPVKRGKKAGELVKLAGTWQGDDLADCLKFVHENRSRAKF
ncbi:MAG TPA: hypothetical protein VK184_21625 [Nostocaceae cyanobacterium]|nr:hypothetical protein [Nostocaceae cyanobacterium]